MAYIVGALCVLGITASTVCMLLQLRQPSNQNQSFRQGGSLPFAASDTAKKVCFKELISASADGYVMTAVCFKVFEKHSGESLSGWLRLVPRFFQPALLQISESSFVFEFYLACIPPLLVLLAF